MALFRLTALFPLTALARLMALLPRMALLSLTALLWLMALLPVSELALAQGAERGSPSGSTGSHEVDTLLEQAERMALHRHPQWLALLHFEPDLLRPGVRSHASSDFFLSPRGNRDARAELEATLRAFFDPDAALRDGQHPQCGFIARRHWLMEQLEGGGESMPLLECAHYEAWRQGLRAKGVTLIYPEGFMNNPASMFGHTLLRIDVASNGSAQEVLGHSVDFTGEAGGDGGLGCVCL